MAITPTYSWPLPDNDDLVKDGAEAIRDLGNAIDTTVGGLPGAGLVHIETQTVSAASAFNFSNDVFTSTYDNYIIMGYYTQSTTDYLLARVRDAGSDISTTTYNFQKTDIGGSGVAASRSTSQTSLQVGYSEAGVSQVFIKIFTPKLARATGIWSENQRNTGSINVQLTWGTNSNATAYDSLSLLAATGNFTGSFSLFGVKK
jgi:hypothetical protein